MNDGSFITFGGFINGSRSSQVVKFKQEGASINADELVGQEESSGNGPVIRAGLSAGEYKGKMFIFGG